MQMLAQECRAYFERKGLALDLTPGSLRIIDTYLANVRPLLQRAAASNDPSAEVEFDRNCQWLAAYVGEVIRTETAGAWTDTRGLPTLDLGEPWIEPLNTMAHLLASGRAVVGGVTVESASGFCDLACRLQLAWLERVVVGSSGSLAALKSAMGGDPQLASWIVNQTQIAVQTAKFKWSKSLDFSPESLRDLEQILGAMHVTCTQAAPGQGPTEEQLLTVAKVWGPYVGEVMRRSYGGQWSVENDGALSLSIGEARLFPMAKVRKRIVNGPGDSIPFYFQATGKVLTGAFAGR